MHACILFMAKILGACQKSRKNLGGETRIRSIDQEGVGGKGETVT